MPVRAQKEEYEGKDEQAKSHYRSTCRQTWDQQATEEFLYIS